MKILKSEKLSSANKWALAVVPHEDFQVLNCVTEKKVTNIFSWSFLSLFYCSG